MICIIAVGFVPFKAHCGSYTVGETEALADGIIDYKLSSAGNSGIQEWIDGYLTSSAGNGSEWYIVGLAQSGKWNFSRYEKALLAYLDGGQVISATSMEKYALALSAVGSSDKYITYALENAVGEQGIMSLIYGLHILNNGHTCGKCSVSSVTKELIELQYDDGGWALFGGRGDIEHSLIRCVGEPEKRFTEDALRIMRGIRFASQLGFGIEEKTAQAIIDMRGRLSIISRERVREELDKLLCGKDCGKVLTDYRVIIAEIIPEMVACFGFDQFSRYHKYDVYEHIVKAVTSAPQDQLILRRALLLHDIAKPQMFTLDENGVGHFKGHAKVSAEMAKEILTRLRFDNRTIALTSQLISHHSDKIHSERQIRLMVSEFGIETFLMLMDFKKYDNCGKNDFVLDENKEFDRFKVIAREFADSGECITLSQLALSGSDLTELGFRGKEIGTALAQLHSLVISGDLPNDKQALTNYILNEINTTLE